MSLFLEHTPNPSEAKSNEIPSGGTFVTASIAEPSNLIPILASDSASQDIVSKVYSGLLKYNPNIELEGDLAERWEVLDEGRKIIFYLKKNVYWHDMKPLTAWDVQFTYNKLIDDKTPSPYRGDFERVKSLEVIDNHTIQVMYEEPFSPALASWTMWIMPRHLLKDEDLIRTDFARNPIGSGPYRFKRWKAGERVDLVAFEHFYEGRPLLDRVIYRIIPDQATMFLELHQEGIDSMGLSPLQYERQTSSTFFENNYRKYKYPSFGYTYLAFNLRDPKFKDIRVRKAIDMAINKQEMVQGIFLGLARVATGPFSPESWAYNSQVKPNPFDPKQSMALLQEAGWEDKDGDGYIEKEGEKFEFTIMTNQGNFQRQQATEMIQKHLGDIGIQVKIKVIEWSSFLKEVVHQHQFDAVLLAWGLSREPDPFDIWHSSKTNPGEFNYIAYSNTEVDELIEIARSTYDLEKRKEAYAVIHRILSEELPYVFLFIPEATPILHQRFENVRVTALGLGYNFNDWGVLKPNRQYTRFEL